MASNVGEMDEFFNFDSAAQPFDHASAAGPYDVNLVFADPEDDENSFTCLQHFSGLSDDRQLSIDMQNSMADVSMMGAEDFTDFSRWIDGLHVPLQPCVYCRRMQIHCKVIKEGQRKGSCTSCVALNRSCSFTFQPSTVVPNVGILHHGALENSGTPRTIMERLAMNDPLLQCEYCQGQGHQCTLVREGSNIGSCTSCVNLGLACSLAPYHDLVNWNIDDGLQPNNVWIPSMVPMDQGPLLHRNSAPDLVALKEADGNGNADGAAPKSGTRFSRESVRILKVWLSTHHRHPYPTEQEKDALKQQTGLNKTQITNWLANARRRGKVRAPRSTSPSPGTYTNGIDIPRRATPLLESLPLERWKHSPPEHEPASVAAIATAVKSATFPSATDSPNTNYGITDDGSSRSLCNVSSTSSLPTSNSSGGSFASAYSYKSKGSFGSFGSFGTRGRRRRRRQASKPVQDVQIPTAPRTFQCTFCAETFKTKHDWQRHEKTLHLSLERWVCSPNGPTQKREDCSDASCVYCGLPSPSKAHAEEHNYSSCSERPLEERTFYRKDHLRQHLNLVHNAKFQSWAMDSWRVATPEIRSRCGFCGIIMDTWNIRVDHLAEHFKGGNSMADWKGDWGFEPQVLELVENGIPPYLIHNERNSMHPFEASKEAQEETTLEDFVKFGLFDYVKNCVTRGVVPTDDDLLTEARQVILKLEDDLGGSWFHDLIMFSGVQSRPDESIFEGAGLLPPELGANPENSVPMDSPTSRCLKEMALIAFVHARRALGLTPTDSELQVEACRILDGYQATSRFQYEDAVSWFKYLISASTTWLARFRKRAELPPSSENAVQDVRAAVDTNSYGMQSTARLENELMNYVLLQSTHGIAPSDVDLQRQARLIMHGNADHWKETAADSPGFLHTFKQQNGLAPIDEDGSRLTLSLEAAESSASLAQDTGTQSPSTLHWNWGNVGTLGTSSSSPTGTGTPQNQVPSNANMSQPLRYCLNDANCYRRLVRELSRFVTSTISPNNPNRHIPSDAELQNQARWVIYDDDDPWNQTAADNAEWLIRFKRDVGLAPPEDGPGLPNQSSLSWRVAMGGSGFSPPYIHPTATVAESARDVQVQMDQKTYSVKANTVRKFLKSVSSRYEAPAKIFCSRELENGLNEFVKASMAKGIYPTDDEIRARAREIIDMDETAADNAQLLEKFKAMHGIPSHTSQEVDPLQDFDPFSDDVAMMAQFDKQLGILDSDTSFLTQGNTNLSLISGTIAAGPGLRKATEGLAAKTDYLPPDAQSLAKSSPITELHLIGQHSLTAEPADLGNNRHGKGAGDERHHSCDADLVSLFEAGEAAKGVKTQEEIGAEASRMLGKYLEKKWKQDGNEEVFLASGKVKRMPRSGMIPVNEWENLTKE